MEVSATLDFYISGTGIQKLNISKSNFCEHYNLEFSSPDTIISKTHVYKDSLVELKKAIEAVLMAAG